MSVNNFLVTKTLIKQHFIGEFKMAQNNDFQTLNSHFKEIYADKIVDLIPEGVKLYNTISFIGAEKQNGLDYVQPVTLGLEHGFTYGGQDGTAFALQNAVASTHKRAQIKGHEMVLRSFLSVGAASRSNNGKGAFVQETKFIVENMLKSFVRRVEVQLMYGQVGLGEVESISGVGNVVIKIEDHEWAAGIWSGAEDMPIDIYTGAVLTLATSVVSYDFDAKTVTVLNDASAVSAADVIYYKGAKGNEFAGLHKIITNDGVLFNIDASAYNLWKGNVVEVGTDFAGNEAVLSFAKIESGIARSMEKGLADEQIEVICNPKSWSNLLTEQVAKRQFDSSYSDSKLKNGAKEIEFTGQNGTIKIMASIYCKEGYAYMLCEKDFMRIGSSDITFERPGLGGEFLKLMEGFNGYEMRAYTDQALFTCCPGKTVLLTFIKS